MELRESEKLITLKQASEALGLPLFKFSRAAKAGQIPTYTLFNSRKYVKLREISEIIEKSRTSVDISASLWDPPDLWPAAGSVDGQLS